MVERFYGLRPPALEDVYSRIMCHSRQASFQNVLRSGRCSVERELPLVCYEDDWDCPLGDIRPRISKTRLLSEEWHTARIGDESSAGTPNNSIVEG
jgi:hypothetical protein